LPAATGSPAFSKMKAANETFNRFDVEAWIIKRIAEERLPAVGCESGRRLIRERITMGRTDWNIRKARIAELINEFELADRRIGVGVSTGIESFAQCYERFYGEPLPRQEKTT
jgi:hypothetical protein